MPWQSCISFDSYIKPQPFGIQLCFLEVVYLLIPTSNHNPAAGTSPSPWVVYLLIPTSNHNLVTFSDNLVLVVYLLIPTSNHNLRCHLPTLHPLYIFWFLHQTTTITVSMVTEDGCISFDSYIKPQPSSCWDNSTIGCISFDSYIKPQLLTILLNLVRVVYLLIPTSNHNILASRFFWLCVVYLLIPTSNHNSAPNLRLRYRVVYLLIPTSNHNHVSIILDSIAVVYLLIPTSNHNIFVFDETFIPLYIFWFLHQTTTENINLFVPVCCISFDSYIKPQLSTRRYRILFVVYLLIPTSNHNSCDGRFRFYALYIFWFLHQTTTYSPKGQNRHGCISFDSYIKPQLRTWSNSHGKSCISFDSYIKPQPWLNPYVIRKVVYLLIPTSNHNSVLG